MVMPKGFKHTAETRAKMSVSAKQRWIDHPRPAESNELIGEKLTAHWANWRKERNQSEPINQVHHQSQPVKATAASWESLLKFLRGGK